MLQEQISASKTLHRRKLRHREVWSLFPGNAVNIDRVGPRCSSLGLETRFSYSREGCDPEKSLLREECGKRKCPEGALTLGGNVRE